MTAYEKHRRKSNMTQDQVATKLGVTQGAVWQWENGISNPRAEILPKIAMLFGCTVDELLLREEGESTS